MSLLQKLKKQKQKSSTQPIEVEGTTTAKPSYRPNAPNIKSVTKISQEQKLITEFFDNLSLSLGETVNSTADVIEEIEKFSRQPYYLPGKKLPIKPPPSRAKLLNSIFVNSLPSSLWENFIREFANQTTREKMNLADFWESYKSRPEIKRKIATGRTESDKAEEIAMDIFGPSVEEGTEVVSREPTGAIKITPQQERGLQKRETVTMGKEDPQRQEKKPKIAPRPPRRTVKPYEDPPSYIPPAPQRTTTKAEYFLNQDCINDMKISPWVGDKVLGIYIADLADNFDKIRRFIARGKNEKIKEYAGKKWYLVSINFYQLMCNRYKSSQVQELDVFSTLEAVGRPISFHIGYETENSGFVIQDELLFQKQQNWYAKKLEDRNIKKTQTMDTPVNDQILKLGKEILSEVLLEVAPTVKEYNVDGVFVNEVIKKIAEKSSNIKDFIGNLSELIVYLRDPEAKIFKERVGKVYYTPDILVSLTPAEKYPEALENPSDEYINKNILVIHQIISEFANQIAEIYYTRINPDVRNRFFVPTGNQTVDELQGQMLGFRKWKSKCVNSADVQDAKDYEVVYYRDSNGDDYCFVIADLLEQYINNKVLRNPYTQDDLSPGFTKRFLQLYGHLVKETDSGDVKLIDESVIPVDIEAADIELAPNFISKMMIDLEACETQAAEKGPGHRCKLPSTVEVDDECERCETKERRGTGTTQYRSTGAKPYPSTGGWGSDTDTDTEEEFQIRKSAPLDLYTPDDDKDDETVTTKDTESTSTTKDTDDTDDTKEDKPKEDEPKEDEPKEDEPKEDKPKEDKPKEEEKSGPSWKDNITNISKPVQDKPLEKTAEGVPIDPKTGKPITMEDLFGDAAYSSDSDASVSSATGFKFSSKNGKTCEKCKGNISADCHNIKTIKSKGNNFEVVLYCSFKCLEDDDSFKKFKGGKKGKKRKKVSDEPCD
jgi:hypothetical protein